MRRTHSDRLLEEALGGSAATPVGCRWRMDDFLLLSLAAMLAICLVGGFLAKREVDEQERQLQRYLDDVPSRQYVSKHNPASPYYDELLQEQYGEPGPPGLP